MKKGKINSYLLLFALNFFSNRGAMAEQLHHPLSHNWVTIKNKEIGLIADFPHQPLEMNFELPFQNTPPQGQVQIYSVPTQNGLLALSTFHSTQLQKEDLKKEFVQWFFEKILVPHFFFNPSVFQDHQVFHFQSSQLDGHPAVHFKISFQDHGVLKKLEGIASIKDHILYVPFYLASETEFDQKILQRFMKSVKFGI